MALGAREGALEGLGHLHIGTVLLGLRFQRNTHPPGPLTFPIPSPPFRSCLSLRAETLCWM